MEAFLQELPLTGVGKTLGVGIGILTAGLYLRRISRLGQTPKERHSQRRRGSGTRSVPPSSVWEARPSGRLPMHAFFFAAAKFH